MELCFWISLGYLAYAYVVFPLALLALARIARRQYESSWGYGLPRVTVVASFAAPAGEDASAIRERVNDLTANGYPPELLEIVIACDGPLAGREELERELSEERGASRVSILDLPDRAGKTAAQNLAARRAEGEVLVFTDADTRLSRGAIEAIVRPLGDPDVGCSCGRLVYEGRSLEWAYWRYETAMKEAESRLHSLLGANGALYAVRRADYAELPPWALSDLVEPLYQLLNGRRTCWAPEAIAREPIGGEPGDTFGRKRRITLRALTSLRLVLPVMNARTRPVTAWLFVSHKLLRWFSWLPMLTLYLSSFALSVDVWYARAAVAQLLFYFYAMGIYLGLPGAAFSAYVIEVASAQLVAGLQWLFGRREIVWRPSGIPARRRTTAR